MEYFSAVGPNILVNSPIMVAWLIGIILSARMLKQEDGKAIRVLSRFTAPENRAAGTISPRSWWREDIPWQTGLMIYERKKSFQRDISEKQQSLLPK